jgi:2-dehydro-3-deoxyphosphogluconate aldolase/(4S)-4-hydroxy-2-oxoglutarate aldolase
MTKPEIIQRLLNPGVVAIIRSDSSENLVPLAETLADSGITAMEVTMTTPNALQVITEISAKLSDRIVIGVGTILDTETCREAILAGAEFVVTPVTKPDVIRLCHRYGKPIMSGAFTPTEALLSHESGADFVKLFPADEVGPGYIKSILAPLPMLRIVPTGGVSPENVGEFLRAGAVAIGTGSPLIPKDALKRGDFAAIKERAADFLAAVEKARMHK